MKLFLCVAYESVCMGMWTTMRMLGTSSSLPGLIPLRQGLSLNLEPGWSPARSSTLLSPLSYSSGITAVCMAQNSFSWWCHRFELWASCFL